MASRRPALELRTLAALPRLAIASVLLLLLGLAAAIILGGQPVLAILVMVPMALVAGQLNEAAPKHDGTDDDPPSTDATAEVSRIVAEAAVHVGVPAPDCTRIVLSGGVRARSVDDRREVRIGIGPLALLSRDDLVILVARELFMLERFPAFDAARQDVTRHLALSHDRLAASYGVLALPAAKLTAALFHRAVSVGRHVHLAIDALAAERLGADALGRALALEAGAASAFEGYWNEDVERVLLHGYLPPIASGLASFLTGVEAGDRVAWSVVVEQAAEHETDRPAAADRLAALGVTSASAPPQPASVPGLDEPAAALARASRPVPLIEMTWAEAIGRTVEEIWTDLVADHRAWLDGLTLEEVPAVLRGMSEREPSLGLLPHDEGVSLMALVSLGLLQAGWSLPDRPGEMDILRRGDETADPFALGDALVRREARPEDFEDWCLAKGLIALPDLDALHDSADGPPRSGAEIPDVPSDTTTAAGVPHDELMAERCIRLAQSAEGRVLGLIALVGVTVIGLPVAALCAWGALHPSAPGTAGLMAAFAVALLAVVALVTRAVFWDVAGRPRVRVDAAGDLTIDHPSLLRRPLRLEREDLLVVDVDTSRRAERFPVTDPRRATTASPVIGWLWRRGEAAPMPVLDRSPDHPNVAIILRHAVSAPPPRGKTWHAIHRHENIDGVLLRTRDPEAMRALFEDLGVLRAVTIDDLQH